MVGVPDLVFEVRSPSTRRYDEGAKKAGYQRAGIGELSLVDPASDTVPVFSGTDAPEVGRGEQLTSPLVRGFSVDVAELFEP